eukprot:3859553-Alexandrium_andersonii.AAC.1
MQNELDWIDKPPPKPGESGCRQERLGETGVSQFEAEMSGCEAGASEIEAETTARSESEAEMS